MSVLTDTEKKRMYRNKSGRRGIPSQHRKTVLEKTNCHCGYCGTPLNNNNTTLDHIIPRIKGGDGSPKNLMACCKSCNTIKRERSLDFLRLRLSCPEAIQETGFSGEQLSWLIERGLAEQIGQIPDFLFYFETLGGNKSMKRTKNKPTLQPSLQIPDAINASTSKNFVQIPNELLRHPHLSFKAKGVLALLLSNKEGWRSYLTTLKQMSREGMEAIQSGVRELEDAHYLMRVQYRDKETKVRRGSFWAYTDIPGDFKIEDALQMLERQGMEAFILTRNVITNTQSGNPEIENPDIENQGLIILNNNKTKNNKTESSSSDEAATPPLLGQDDKKIVPSQFEDFWKAYPRKVDKGKAKTAWLRICGRQNGTRPTWKEVRRAVHRQKKSDRWQEEKFIPHPTTWLNQERWLDDPEQMKSSFNDKPKSKVTIGTGWTGRYDESHKRYLEYEKQKQKEAQS